MARLILLIINLIGGIAVLGSYVIGIVDHPEQVDLLWGTLPAGVRGVYTANMFPAAIGYLVSFGWLIAAAPDRLRLAGRPALPILSAVYAVFLASSTAWMPLCWQAIDQSDSSLLPVIQVVLALAGVASVGLLVVLARLTDPPRPRWHRAAIIGLGFLVLQCAILDALIWPQFFGVPG
ncbi:MAG: hypothetical protein ACI8RZ_000113 [Myxococcota bacterium]|jgi:hypothetical protein